MLWKASILLPILLATLARAQPQAFPQLRFAQLTEKDGLSCNQVSDVTQDDEGLIWIGTANGLNRFDGYGCTQIFANTDDTGSLPSNELIHVSAGRQHDLWLQTAAGICRYHIATHTFDNFQSGPSTPSVFRDYEGCNIWFDPQGAVYITAPEGLYHFTDNRHYTIMDEGLQPFVRRERTFRSYGDIVSDHSGGLWAFRENMIFRLDPQTKRVIRSFTLPPSVGVYDLLFDHRNRCWVSTWHSGILRFDCATGGFSVISPPKPPADVLTGPGSDVIGLGAEWVFSGRFFLAFACNAPGLLLVDEETGKSQLYLHEAGLRAFGRPFVDRQNILWIPTNKGVSYLNAAANIWDVIPTYIHRDGTPDLIDQTTPYVMREEDNGYWIGRRYSGGMLWYDRNWRLIRSWRKVVDSVGAPVQTDAGTPSEAFDFRRLGNEMFISTEFGIVVLNLKTFTRTLVGYPGIPLLRLRTIVAPDNRHWWIRSFDHGVFVFDPVLRRFTGHYHMPGTCVSCEPLHVNYLLRSRSGVLFASTTNGLLRYEAGGDRFIALHPRGHPAVGSTLIGMAEDSAGLIWIGSDNGVFAYDPVKDSVVRNLSEKNSVGFVYRVTVDSAQNVWFTSPAGYWCWLRRQDKTVLFGLGPGLPDNDEALLYTASNGNVYAGCFGALVWFHADKLRAYNVAGTAKIMDVLVGDSAVLPGTDGKNNRQVLLGPGDNRLRINFDVINYDIPANNLFFYELRSGSGGMKAAHGAENWTQVENGRLSFNNLAPGDYELSVRGGNKLTGNYTDVDKLLIGIRPYWWQSPGFKAVVALALLVLVVLVVRVRIRAIRRESAFREKIAQTEMQALRAQMNPHFIFNSLTSIENFIMSNERRLASDYLSKFARLIRMILDSSRNELVPLSKDMEALQLYVDLEQLRFDNKFCYRTEIDPILLDGDFRVPSLLIQPYVENAIVHGIRYSERKDLVVCVRVFAEEDHVHLVIRDNGIGRRRAAEINRLNRPYHTSIGLGITEDRINIFSRQQGSAGSVRITDLVDNEGQAAGTQVEVVIRAVE
jgi:ligand-binding sensor domain-containing protein